MNCYKMVRQGKSFSDAELACQKDGGSIAKPITKEQVGNIYDNFNFYLMLVVKSKISLHLWCLNSKLLNQDFKVLVLVLSL